MNTDKGTLCQFVELNAITKSIPGNKYAAPVSYP